MISLLLLATLAAAEPCKYCWNASCPALKDVGMPACVEDDPKPPKKTKKKKNEKCNPGEVTNVDTQGYCCWPGQAYSSVKKECIGAPDCPDGFKLEGDVCLQVVECPPDALWNGSVCVTTISPEGTKGRESKLEPKTGLLWMGIAAGRFHYGCVPSDTRCYADEKPGGPQAVDAFWLMQTEVTVAAWAACAAAGQCSFEPKDIDFEPVKTCNWRHERNEHPMNCINAEEAASFCRWVGGRLPTAVEWEYAAKSGGNPIYAWGDELVSGGRANFCDAQCAAALTPIAKKTYLAKGWVALGEDDGWAATAPVGTFPNGATDWGLLDITGNVQEFTASDYDSSNIEVRGGSWSGSPPNLRLSHRGKIGTQERVGYIGFRCAE